MVEAGPGEQHFACGQGSLHASPGWGAERRAQGTWWVGGRMVEKGRLLLWPGGLHGHLHWSAALPWRTVQIRGW